MKAGEAGGDLSEGQRGIQGGAFSLRLGGISRVGIGPGQRRHLYTGDQLK
jgi:hypothetical protein